MSVTVLPLAREPGEEGCVGRESERWGPSRSNQSTASASSPATGRVAESPSAAANQTPIVGLSGSWKFEATCSTSPMTTSTPASSRAAGVRTASPHSDKTARDAPGARAPPLCHRLRMSEYGRFTSS